ncbi:MAG: hypothetical protein Q4A28_07715, partial [Brachymonas sp.]|nr:hypothetical protein [Brachymonas sp.]
MKIYLLGMNERGRQTMRMFLDRHLRDDCQATGMAQEAQAVLVDIDSYRSEKALQQHMKQFPQQRVIALSIAPEKYSDTDWLLVRKPDEALGLKNALQQLQKQFFTSAPAA